jgi:hypothetical protein
LFSKIYFIVKRLKESVLKIVLYRWRALKRVGLNKQGKKKGRPQKYEAVIMVVDENKQRIITKAVVW